MAHYVITEVVTYEVEAECSLDAYEKVFNTTGGLVDHLVGVTDREVFEDGLPVPEPTGWDA